MNDNVIDLVKKFDNKLIEFERKLNDQRTKIIRLENKVKKMNQTKINFDENN